MNRSASKAGLVSVSAMNAISAVTLIVTSTALNLALSLVPMMSSPVISSAMTIAGRLISPPATPPSASGPADSQLGKATPSVSSRILPTKYPDQPTETALAAMAYSSTSAQPTVQARSSPIVA